MELMSTQKNMGSSSKHATPHDTMTLIAEPPMPQGSHMRIPTHWKSPTAPIDWTMGWDMKQRLKSDSSKHWQLPTKKNVAVSQAYHTNLQTWRSWLPRWKTSNIVSWRSKWTTQNLRTGWGHDTTVGCQSVCNSLRSSEKRSIWSTHISLKKVARIPRNSSEVSSSGRRSPQKGHSQ